MTTPSRNQPCPCGSGKRYKECHGRVSDAALADLRPVPRLMAEALAHQHARRLAEAEALYREVLAVQPGEPDALHMLGVIRYERGDLAEARDLIVRSLDQTGWRIPTIRQNLGLVLSKQNAVVDSEALAALRHRYGGFLAERQAKRHTSRPLVSVVIPSYNHATYIERALRSVFDQTYRDIELIVLDDGSRDGSPAMIADCLSEAPFPQRLIARSNRGAPATLNEGFALARGAYVQFLNSDDWLAPERIARMVAEVADIDGGWGFSAVSIRNEVGDVADVMRNRRAYDLTCSIAAIPFRDTAGSPFLTENVSVSTGNLFVSRSLLDRLGGFRHFRYNHDWDFCLRAVKEEEPVFVAEQLYCYRLHGANTIAESAAGARAEAHDVCADYLAWARSAASPVNPFAPAVATWGPLFTSAILNGGMGGLLDADALRKLTLATTG